MNQSNFATNDHSCYGTLRAEQIRATAKKYNELSDFEKFVLDRGHEFDTEAELQSAYERFRKTQHGTLLSLEEFLTEAKARDQNLAAESYHALVRLVEKWALSASDVYQYARFRWCISSPDAIVAYMTGPQNFWSVNNCDVAISEDRARLTICEEWGFEASRVKIIGTPYYDATDWNFIRFDCATMTWLMQNGELYQVYQ